MLQLDGARARTRREQGSLPTEEQSASACQMNLGMGDTSVGPMAKKLTAGIYRRSRELR